MTTKAIGRSRQESLTDRSRRLANGRQNLPDDDHEIDAGSSRTVIVAAREFARRSLRLFRVALAWSPTDRILVREDFTARFPVRMHLR